MKRFVVVAFVLLAACGGDKPKLTEPKNTPTTVETLAAPPTGQAGASTTLIPADAAAPAAGACATAEGGFADIKLNPDMPEPRCMIVAATDQLRIENATESDVDIDTGFSQVTLAPHETSIVGGGVAQYWEPGVHVIKTGRLYDGNGPEVWLK